MNEGESIEDTYGRFAKLIGDLKALGRTYTQYEQVVRILRSVLVAWQSKATTPSMNSLMISCKACSSPMRKPTSKGMRRKKEERTFPSLLE